VGAGKCWSGQGPVWHLSPSVTPCPPPSKSLACCNDARALLPPPPSPQQAPLARTLRAALLLLLVLRQSQPPAAPLQATRCRCTQRGRGGAPTTAAASRASGASTQARMTRWTSATVRARVCTACKSGGTQPAWPAACAHVRSCGCLLLDRARTA